MTVAANDIRDWVIYKLESPSGRIYIGKTVNISWRKSSYKTLNCKAQKNLYSSLLKYGYNNHSITIIDSFEGCNSYASGKEMFWIRSYMSNKNKFPKQNGLNLTDGGDGAVGYKMSDENKKRLRQLHKQGGRKRNTGMKHSEESKQKMSKALRGRKSWNKGKKLSKEHIENLSKSHIGQVAWNKGTKGVMKAWNKGLKFDHLSEEERKKRFGSHNIGNNYCRGRKMTENQKDKFGRANKGKIHLGRRKTVLVYDIRNTFIKKVVGISAAAKEFGVSRKIVDRSLTGVTKTNKHFIFKYKAE